MQGRPAFAGNGLMRPPKAPLLATLLLMALVPVASFAMPNEVRIPIVREHVEDDGDPPDAALFSHWSHERHKCYACHPQPFPQGRKGFTHDHMDRGLYCASCHDGKKAFAVDDADCETCHVPARD